MTAHSALFVSAVKLLSALTVRKGAALFARKTRSIVSLAGTASIVLPRVVFGRLMEVFGLLSAQRNRTFHACETSFR
ncbi:hypothetical protein B5F40_00495 [Gordonibacter sp. An230]|nr:hypothetical protein B5F40_00495 [Gordonibacter sp. An230]